MGSGIAAHLANLGFEVTLFDLTPESVASAFEKAKTVKPPHFFNQDAVAKVRLASIINDIDLIGEMDWVCEAIVEKLELKRDLYEKIQSKLKEDSMISTNTSGLEIRLLCEGFSESFRKRFIGTHFFNPPRYLKLIELIPTDYTDKQVVETMTEFLEDSVGRRVVLAKDTPGFIANRYGMWALFHAIHTAEKLRLSIEVVDQIMGPFCGRPKTGIFRLADLIGMDIMKDIAGNLQSRCTHDPNMQILDLPKTTGELLMSERLGTKSGRGYYERAGNEFFVVDFDTMAYRPQQDPELPTIKELAKKDIATRLRESLRKKDEVGDFLREHLVPALEYAQWIANEVSFSAKDFDEVMKWGWGWEFGPFEMIDIIGKDLLNTFWQQDSMENVKTYYQNGNYFSFESKKYESQAEDKRFADITSLQIVEQQSDWNIRSVSDSHFVFEFKTKMNSINPEMVNALNQWIIANPGIKITLANSGRAFSAGFDLTYFLDAAEAKKFDEVDAWLKRLQGCGLSLRNSPSAAALHGFSLGGGLELAMHCQALRIHPEATLGLPETTVGLIPAGGGTTLLRYRSQNDPKSMVAAASFLITGGKTHASTANSSFLTNESSLIVKNSDQLHFHAINASREKVPDPVFTSAPPQLSGMIEDAIEQLKKNGQISDYGVTLAHSIKQIFVKATTYEESLEMEREQFLHILGKPMTIARIKHMLETGKPLNN